MVTQSAFYEGTVFHRRTSDVDHEFSVPLFMVYVDLDELPELLNGVPGWSSTRPAIARFSRSDHFGNNDQSLQESVREKTEELTGRRVTGPIRLLTHFRYFGYLFNPVSFFYCFSRDERLQAVLAEVHNTPWHEEHVYGLPATKQNGHRNSFSVTLDKDFHVSPFQPMDQSYRISFGVPGEELFVEIQSMNNGNQELSAKLEMDRKPFTTKNAFYELLRYPLMTFRVTGTIYFEALRLWLKGATFYPHPKTV